MVIFLFKVAVGFTTNSEENKKFLREIPIKMAQPPWNYNITLEHRQIVRIFVYLEENVT